MNELHHRGYVTRIHYSARDNLLYGKIENTQDLITFESNTCDGIVEEFNSAVDDYIEYKEKINEQHT